MDPSDALTPPARVGDHLDAATWKPERPASLKLTVDVFGSPIPMTFRRELLLPNASVYKGMGYGLLFRVDGDRLVIEFNHPSQTPHPFFVIAVCELVAKPARFVMIVPTLDDALNDMRSGRVVTRVESVRGDQS